MDFQSVHANGCEPCDRPEDADARCVRRQAGSAGAVGHHAGTSYAALAVTIGSGAVAGAATRATHAAGPARFPLRRPGAADSALSILSGPGPPDSSRTGRHAGAADPAVRIHANGTAETGDRLPEGKQGKTDLQDPANAFHGVPLPSSGSACCSA